MAVLAHLCPPPLGAWRPTHMDVHPIASPLYNSCSLMTLYKIDIRYPHSLVKCIRPCMHGTLIVVTNGPDCTSRVVYWYNTQELYQYKHYFWQRIHSNYKESKRSGRSNELSEVHWLSSCQSHPEWEEKTLELWKFTQHTSWANCLLLHFYIPKVTSCQVLYAQIKQCQDTVTAFTDIHVFITIAKCENNRLMSSYCYPGY